MVTKTNNDNETKRGRIYRFFYFFRVFFFGPGGTFSTKKFYAFVFSALGIIDKIILLFNTENHWSVILSKNNVPAMVISTLEGSLTTLVIGSLTIYGWNKQKEISQNHIQ